MGTGVVRASGPSLTPFEGTLPVTRSGYVPSPSAPACFISPHNQVHPADNRLGPRADFHYVLTTVLLSVYTLFYDAITSNQPEFH